MDESPRLTMRILLTVNIKYIVQVISTSSLAGLCLKRTLHFNVLKQLDECQMHLGMNEVNQVP
jgi:hypothetical protein